MRFELTVALRYLTSSRLQSALLLLGVAVGILVFTFIAALINGLRVRITEDVIGNLPHVTLEPPDRLAPLLSPTGRATALVARQPRTDRRPEITSWRALAEVARGVPNVATVSPEAVGSGFLQRGERVEPVSVTGVEPENLSAIADVAGGLVRGSPRIGAGDVVIGSELARNLGVDVGQRVFLRTDRGGERTLLVRGLFRLENPELDERSAFLDRETARKLLAVESGVNRIEIKLRDPYAAQRAGRLLEAATRLEVSTWIDRFGRIQEALRAQATTGNLIKSFSLVTIVIGVASALLLAATRRRAEIGIMRSFGVSRRSIAAIFVVQGLLIGCAGALLGAALGYGFSSLLLRVLLRPDGTPSLPLDPAQGEYLRAVALATAVTAAAAILPAISASRVDPVEALQP